MTLIDEIVRDCGAHGLALHRASPRGVDRLALEFRDHQGGVVAGQWHRDPARAAHVARGTARACDEQDVTLLPGTGIVVQRRGADRRVSALRSLLAVPGAELVSHRAERRAVVRLPDASYVKAVPPAKVAAVARGGDIEVESAAVRVPRLLAVDRAQGTVRTAALSGRTFETRLCDPTLCDDEVVEDARAVGAALRSFHRQRPLPGGIPPHDTTAELRVTRGWLEAATRFKLLHVAWERELTSAGDALRRDPEPVGLVHRDLHDKQLLVDGSRPVGLLDLDLATLGEAAVDLANLVAHLQLRYLQGRCSRSRTQRCISAFLTGYAPSPEILARIPAYLATTRLRLAGVYAFRGVPRDLVDELLRAGIPEEVLA